MNDSYANEYMLNPIWNCVKITQSVLNCDKKLKLYTRNKILVNKYLNNMCNKYI